MPFDLIQCRRSFEKAFILFEKRHDASGVFLAWSGVLEFIVHELGRSLSELDQWVTALDRLLSEYGGFPSPRIEAQATGWMFTVLSLKWPDHPRFDYWKDRAFALLNMDVDDTLQMFTAFYLFIYHVWMGDYTRCAQVGDFIASKAKGAGVSPLAQIKGKGAEAYLQWLACSYGACMETVSDGLMIAEKTGVHISDYVLMVIGVIASLAASNLSKAENLFEKMAAFLGKGRFLSEFYYHYESSWYYLLKDDISRSLVYQEKALAVSAEMGMPYPSAQGHLAMAQLMQLRGEYKKARHLLLRGQMDVDRMKSSVLQFVYFLTNAKFAFDQGDEKKGLTVLRDAMALGREHGHLNFSWWRPSDLLFLCIKALENGIEVEYVQGFIRSRNLIPEAPPLACENWPWLFRLHTLGGFELKKDGKPVEIPQKPLSLLKALISFGGREVAGERLAYELWTDSEGDAAHTSLEVTLLRLRRLIGSEKAIQLRAGKVSLDPYSFWVDVWALEHIYDKLAKRLKRVEQPKGGKTKRREIEDEKNEIMQLADKALGLHKGHFLPADTSCPWTLGPRGNWRSKFLRLITMTGSYLEGMQQYEKAAEYFQKGLEVDSLAEEFYQRLMVCYGRLGRKAEAMAVYDRCCDALSSALGAHPSPATEAIYSSLKRSRGAA